jgi:hypothetical protein
MSDLTLGIFLDLSNAHLSQNTFDNLASYSRVVAHETLYGYLLWVPPSPVPGEADWPPELGLIVELARTNGCRYVLFDIDGPTTEQLPTFDW